jgi:Endoplasmic Reticulum-Golgi Intermediate Compartment (ERGIC)
MSMSVLDVLKRFDAYPKTLEDFRIKTLGGGTITLLSAIVMLFLFVSETQDYLTPGGQCSSLIILSLLSPGKFYPELSQTDKNLHVS